MKTAATATLLDYLVDYDGPQLAVLRSARGRNMLAHAIDERSGMKEPFFGCEVPERAFDRYFDGRSDLHFTFQQANQSSYYFFDNAFVEDKGDVVDLDRANQNEIDNPDYWPAGGFFSRSHTSSFNMAPRATGTRTFKIDGKWGAADFSHFYGKMSDLYALFAVLNRLDGQSKVTEKAFLSKTLRDRLWRGGGSYVGFYDDLDNRNEKHDLAPLEVSRIQYASPGQIVLRGNGAVLSSTGDAIVLFEERSKELLMRYNELHNILRKARMLASGPDTSFPSRATRDFVLERTREFANEMKLGNVQEIYEASGPNVLVFSKLVLSIYRRAKELYMFEAEGRIQRV